MKTFDHVMQDYAKFGPTLLRVALGVIFIAHSAYLKVVLYTVPGTVDYFQSIGLPGLLAYAVIAAEIAGGVLLIVGVRVREAAAVLTVVSLGAVWAHAGAGWLFTNAGGGWEYPLLLAVASAAQVLLGAGAYSLRLPNPGARVVLQQ